MFSFTAKRLDFQRTTKATKRKSHCTLYTMKPS